MLPPKELASVHELFQNVLVYRFVTPFALCKFTKGANPLKCGSAPHDVGGRGDASADK